MIELAGEALRAIRLNASSTGNAGCALQEPTAGPFHPTPLLKTTVSLPPATAEDTTMDAFRFEGVEHRGSLIVLRGRHFRAGQRVAHPVEQEGLRK
jgi:hypothetical protein